MTRSLDNIKFWEKVIETNADNEVNPRYTLGNIEKKKADWVEKAHQRIKELSK